MEPRPMSDPQGIDVGTEAELLSFTNMPRSR